MGRSLRPGERGTHGVRGQPHAEGATGLQRQTQPKTSGALGLEGRRRDPPPSPEAMKRGGGTLP